ncbi:hypothetical protein GCK72_025805 [Caenorhabditis remanei]|uniref:K Homology domain-containing protein n=1 Tax=Caenorhabditis remanei TaxID=31234 RepID=A0A6A5G2Y5_CAERE|nr:hypothetical protein GCK72_025805 [Caenorhabditis remanei]KAF1749338.1 hypothetical protein GCK72_025805 [Caenorhabditis remanei]
MASLGSFFITKFSEEDQYPRAPRLDPRLVVGLLFPSQNVRERIREEREEEKDRQRREKENRRKPVHLKPITDGNQLIREAEARRRERGGNDRSPRRRAHGGRAAGTTDSIKECKKEREEESQKKRKGPVSEPLVEDNFVTRWLRKNEQSLGRTPITRSREQPLQDGIILLEEIKGSRQTNLREPKQEHNRDSHNDSRSRSSVEDINLLLRQFELDRRARRAGDSNHPIKEVESRRRPNLNRKKSSSPRRRAHGDYESSQNRRRKDSEADRRKQSRRRSRSRSPSQRAHEGRAANTTDSIRECNSEAEEESQRRSREHERRDEEHDKRTVSGKVLAMDGGMDGMEAQWTLGKRYAHPISEYAKAACEEEGLIFQLRNTNSSWDQNAPSPVYNYLRFDGNFRGNVTIETIREDLDRISLREMKKRWPADVAIGPDEVAPYFIYHVPEGGYATFVRTKFHNDINSIMISSGAAVLNMGNDENGPIRIAAKCLSEIEKAKKLLDGHFLNMIGPVTTETKKLRKSVQKIVQGGKLYRIQEIQRTTATEIIVEYRKYGPCQKMTIEGTARNIARAVQEIKEITCKDVLEIDDIYEIRINHEGRRGLLYRSCELLKRINNVITCKLDFEMNEPFGTIYFYGDKNQAEIGLRMINKRWILSQDGGF